MDYDILGGFIDPKTLDQFDKLDQRVKQSADEMDLLIGKMGKVGFKTDYSSQASAMAAANEKVVETEKKVNTEKQRRIKLTIEEKVAAQALAAQQKINATATSEQVTQLQRLTAQMKVLEMEMQSKFNPALKEQSAEFRNLNAQHQKMQAEFSRTARATGVMGRSMNSSYGSTFQLTQVMRELPNFAIDARIGFMALSNNLPMLADSFKQLKQQIIDTEGAAGASRKTWAAFGKSLLSLNTIMIVASTLLVLFGDDIVNWIGKVFQGEKAIERLSNQALGLNRITEILSKTMKDGGGVYKDAISAIEKQSIALKAAKGDTDLTEKAVADYNDTLGVTFGKVTNVDDALKLIAKNKDAYIQAMQDMAYANAFFAQSANDAVKTMEIGQQTSVTILGQRGKELESAINKTKETIKSLERDRDVVAVTKGAKEQAQSQIDFAKGTLKRQQEALRVEGQKEYARQIEEIQKNQKLSLDEATKYYEKWAQAYKDNGWEFEKNEKNKVEVVRQTFAKMNALQAPALIGVTVGKKPNTPTPVTGTRGQKEFDLNQTLAMNNAMYEADLINYEDYQKKRNDYLRIAAKAGYVISSENMKAIEELEAANDAARRERTSEMVNAAFDSISTIMDGFAQRYSDMLDKQLEKDKKVNDERLQIVKDKEEAGILTKQQAQDETDRINAYALGQEEEMARKKEEAEKRNFLFQQGLALAQIVFNTAMAITNPITNPLGALTPFILGMAGIQAALVLGQAIPAFAEGGTMGKDGKALIGDGGKNELVMTPTGDWYVSPKVPTVVDMKAGTKIYPDVNKIDLNSFLAMAQVQPQKSYDMLRVESVLKNIEKGLAKQKTPRISTQRLFDQINSSDRISRRKRGLMN